VPKPGGEAGPEQLTVVVVGVVLGELIVTRLILTVALE